MAKLIFVFEFDEHPNKDAPRPDCRDSQAAPTLRKLLTKRLWRWLEPTLRVLLQIVLLQIMVAVLPLLVSAA